MGRCSNRGESSLRRERVRRERVSRKKIKVREKVYRSRNIIKYMFFQWFVAPVGRRVRSLQRWVWSHLVVWEIKKCTPLWREARFEVKMLKKKPCSGQFWQLRCRKSARSCGEAHVEVKSLKTLQPRGTFRTWVAEKMHAAVAKNISKWNPKNTTVFGPFLDVQVSFFVAGARDSAPCQKWAKRVGFAAVSKTMAGVGPLKRIWTTLHYTTLHYASLKYNFNCNSTTPHDTTVHLQLQLQLPLPAQLQLQLRYTPDYNYTTLHHIAPHYNYNYDYNYKCTTLEIDRQTDRQTDRQIDRYTNR